MTTREEWIAGARPKTLPAAIAPVLVGTAFAGYNANAVNFFLALVVGVALQVGVNYANDYSDGVKGTDKDRVGPMRLVGSGAATPEAVKHAALIAIAIAAIAGVSLAARSSWILIALGVLSIIAAWTYTGGPKPYGYFALGEVSVFIFFGLVATLGTYFAHVGSLSFEVLLASFAMGCLACAILVLNNLRDLEKDKLAGKITLAVKIGHSQTRRFYQALLFTPLLIAIALVPTSFYFLLAFLALPQILKVTASIRTGASGSALIELLERTGKIQIIYSLAISLASLLYAR
ncbi:MAG: 1,4-dihydroxy-2-naphthoate polyprenyltransferase [Actinobacteria bacterium]|nr:1,4-dihydroxy-2-naphthoate polyprenyltransferase [Actinomycetota bacterium]